MNECDGESQEISTPKPVTTTTTTKKRVEPKVRLIQNDSTPSTSKQQFIIVNVWAKNVKCLPFQSAKTNSRIVMPL